ncbi:MAG: hypothetical protein KTR32_01585 [Granulosicoccus sp.]|nr:hypothetical protein [Granulosicoccus sp.]
MKLIRQSGATLALGISVFMFSQLATADIWIVEPSVALDQRIDDNYYLLPDSGSTLGATRAVGDVGLSRESEIAAVRGRVRADALLTTENDVGDRDLDYNALVAFDAKFRLERSRYGVLVSLKQDTPSRDIAADISDANSVATDTGLTITQSLSSNVARRELVLKPNFQYDVTRRLLFDTNATFSKVAHDLPSSQDAIYQQYLSLIAAGAIEGDPEPYGQIGIEDLQTTGPGSEVFSPTGELDDYVESKIELGLRYKLDPISTFSATAGLGRFVADVEIDPAVQVQEEDFMPDPAVPQIRRKPRRESIATTRTIKLGYERFLRPNLQLAVNGGLYTNNTDDTDTLRPDDVTFLGTEKELEIKTNGWLASVGLNYNSGTTRYAGKFAVDVQPSSSGAQVETNELTGELFRILSPRTTFSFRARAYEPDRLGALREDRFSRRFISFEPKLQWRFTRNWTLITAYRYRRQKARVDLVSAESNAVLLSVKYTPPSEIRDAARASGL